MQKAVPDTGVYDAKGWWERGKRESVVEKFHSAKIKKKKQKKQKNFPGRRQQKQQQYQVQNEKIHLPGSKTHNYEKCGEGSIGGGVVVTGSRLIAIDRNKRKFPAWE